MQQSQSLRPLIDVAEAARLTGVSVRTIRAWQAARAISYVKVNRLVRFDAQLLLAEVMRFTRHAAK